MIDDNSLGDVKIPMLKNCKKIEEINSLILQANQLRYEAYKLEQEAIEIMNKEIFGL